MTTAIGMEQLLQQAFYDGFRLSESRGPDPLRTDGYRWQAAAEYASQMLAQYPRLSLFEDRLGEQREPPGEPR